jgi:ribokinase
MTHHSRNRIVVLGSLNMDLVVQVGRLPVPGETVLGGTFQTAGGGKGANQAVAAARVGGRVGLIGCLGHDAYGRQLRALLRRDAIDLRAVRQVFEPTGVAVVVVESGGQNLIAVVPGANDCVSPADVAAAQPAIARADVVVAQLEVPLEAVTAAAAVARQAGVPFILNAAPARAGLEKLLEDVDVLVVNETELGVVSDRPIEPGAEGEAARALIDRGPRTVVVTLGAHGAVVVDRHAACHIPAFDVAAVDATAAGDAFVGALAARFRGPDTLLAAARYASAAGALACTRRGAQPSLPWAEEIDALNSG